MEFVATLFLTFSSLAGVIWRVGIFGSEESWILTSLMPRSSLIAHLIPSLRVIKLKIRTEIEIKFLGIGKVDDQG